MSIWSKIFSSSDVVKEGISMLRDTGDALFYTDEEKAIAHSERLAAERAVITDWMATTKGQNLARRMLAVMITIVWLSMYVISVLVSVATVFIDNPAQWQQASALIGNYAEQMNGAMMLILAFYFAAPHMGKVVDSALSKFGGNK